MVEDDEKDQGSVGWVVLRRICGEQGIQETPSQLIDDEHHYTRSQESVDGISMVHTRFTINT